MSTETEIISGEDYSATDAEARAIMDYLADQGVTEEKVARTSYRVLVNMILQAQRVLDGGKQLAAAMPRTFAGAISIEPNEWR